MRCEEYTLSPLHIIFFDELRFSYNTFSLNFYLTRKILKAFFPLFDPLLENALWVVYAKLVADLIYFFFKLTCPTKFRKPPKNFFWFAAHPSSLLISSRWRMHGKKFYGTVSIRRRAGLNNRLSIMEMIWVFFVFIFVRKFFESGFMSKFIFIYFICFKLFRKNL